MPATFTHRQDLASRSLRAAAEDGDGGGKIAPRCAHVRDLCAEALDDAASCGVLGEDEIQQLSRHTAHCLTCMEEFIGLIKATASASPSGTVIDPSEDAATVDRESGASPGTDRNG
jgi:hypothetical protein